MLPCPGPETIQEMAFEDDYYDHLTRETRVSLKIQRSEFIGISFPVTTESDFQHVLESLRREMYDATHHCWAFRRYGAGEIHDRSADAGEPSGTAGRPILQALEDAGLLDSGIVVVRYYGGVKLGTGGLARAYRDAARKSLEEAPRTRRYLYERIDCRPSFEQMNQIYRMIEPPDLLLAEERFDPEPGFALDVRRSLVDEVRAVFREQRIPFDD